MGTLFIFMVVVDVFYLFYGMQEQQEHSSQDGNSTTSMASLFLTPWSKESSQYIRAGIKKDARD